MACPTTGSGKGSARAAQMAAARLAAQGRWREAWAEVMRLMNPPTPAGRLMGWFISSVMSFDAPENPSDFVVTVEAEDRHDFRGRLGEITAPALVVAGVKDPFYSETLFKETAAGMPNARLILYPGMGHPAWGRQFERDVLAFLKQGA